MEEFLAPRDAGCWMLSLSWMFGGAGVVLWIVACEWLCVVCGMVRVLPLYLILSVLS